MRFGSGALADLGEVGAELGLERLVLVTTRRGAAAAGSLPVVATFDGVRPHVPVETVAEAAEYLRCKPQRIYDLRSSGRLPRHGDGSRVLIRRADLDAHLDR